VLKGDSTRKAEVFLKLHPVGNHVLYIKLQNAMKNAMKK